MPEKTDILQTILKDSSFDLSLFSVKEINALRQKIFIKAARGKEQLRCYCNATGSPMSVWTIEDITDIPKAGQSLQDILGERFTLRDLISKDKIANERKLLKDIILDMEDEVFANAGVDFFEEVFNGFCKNHPYKSGDSGDEKCLKE